MNKLFISTLLISLSTTVLYSENNESNITTEANVSKIIKTDDINSSESKAQIQLEKQMEREKKYAKEQRFYQGSEFDLSSFEIDKSSLDDIPLLEPDYDFNMDDVYD